MKDPDPYLWLTDPDPYGPTTYGSGHWFEVESNQYLASYKKIMQWDTIMYTK